MPLNAAPRIDALLNSAGPRHIGKVMTTDGTAVGIAGLGNAAKLGDLIRIETDNNQSIKLQVVALERDYVRCVAFQRLTGIAIGDNAVLEGTSARIAPCDGWVGRILNAFGDPLDGRSLPNGDQAYPLENIAPTSALRKPLGPRLSTGFNAFNTFLPICRGQRVGLFAGSGIGKSILLGQLTRQIKCDVAVIALIGERGREVRSFIEETLGTEGLSKSVVFVATADESALAKKRAANLAVSTAEYFRNQGKQVLLVFDSLTRYAESHREIALAAGEAPTLHAFPPSTFQAIASLVERAGPGLDCQGDITAVLSVLVAGSDMEEPVSDMVRGILDGHIILDRRIAERGRYPAIDILRSVSRSLPSSASLEQFELLGQARAILRTYEDSETIVRAGLYAAGTDPQIDRALAIWPKLEAFCAVSNASGIEASYNKLYEILNNRDDERENMSTSLDNAPTENLKEAG